MSGVVLEVLFVPRKAETLSIIRKATESMDINFHVCTDPEEVERLLFCHRFDGLILDHDEHAERLLRALRQSPSSRSAIAVDVHEPAIDLQSVFSLGANFEIVAPLTVERVRRTMHLALGLMLLGRRRYYRHPVHIAAQVWVGERQVDAWISNVSESGIAFRSERHTWEVGPVQCSFVLPEAGTRIWMEASVVWADKAGQAGCRIEQITQGRDQYLEWMCQLFDRGHAAMLPPLRNPSTSPAMA